MTVIAGTSAVVDGEDTIRAWRVRHVNKTVPYVASNTNGAVSRIVGVNDWTGWYLGYGHTPANFPGDAFTFTGNVADSVGATGDARCERFDLNWSPATGGLIEYRVFFGSNGALTIGATSSVSDSTSPNPPTSACMKIELDGTEVDDLTQFAMSIRARNLPYVSSSNCVTNVPRTKRIAGPVDGEMTFRFYQGAFASIPSVGSIDVAKLYVTSTTYWQLSSVIIDSVEPEPDHMSNEPVAVTCHASFTGFSAGAAGVIANPAGSEKWSGT
jgi:hypothetical protein